MNNSDHTIADRAKSKLDQDMDAVVLRRRKHAVRVLRDCLQGTEQMALTDDQLRLPAAELDEVFATATLLREVEAGGVDAVGGVDESGFDADISKPWIAQRAIEKYGGIRTDSTRQGVSFQVFFTHDIDRTTLCEPTSLVKAALKAVGLRREGALGFDAVLPRRSVLNIIERLLDIESAAGIGAIYFMMAGPYEWGQMGTRTDIRWRLSRDIARLITEAGMRVGLHGSAHARERDSYTEEKARIEQALGMAIETHRNHYLRFDPLRLAAQLEAAEIAYDFSFGSAHEMGFRGGYAHACPAYNFPQERSARVMSIPLLFMDTAFIGQDPEYVLGRLRRCLEQVKAVQGCVSLLFHPEWFLTGHAPFALFEGAIELCQEMGADLTGQLPARWWDKQQAADDVGIDEV